MRLDPCWIGPIFGLDDRRIAQGGVAPARQWRVVLWCPCDKSLATRRAKGQHDLCWEEFGPRPDWRAAAGLCELMPNPDLSVFAIELWYARARRVHDHGSASERRWVCFKEAPGRKHRAAIRLARSNRSYQPRRQARVLC
jgi:hypothetical protein